MKVKLRHISLYPDPETPLLPGDVVEVPDDIGKRWVEGKGAFETSEAVTKTIAKAKKSATNAD